MQVSPSIPVRQKYFSESQKQPWPQTLSSDCVKEAVQFVPQNGTRNHWWLSTWDIFFPLEKLRQHVPFWCTLMGIVGTLESFQFSEWLKWGPSFPQIKARALRAQWGIVKLLHLQVQTKCHMIENCFKSKKKWTCCVGVRCSESSFDVQMPLSLWASAVC